MKQLKRSMDIYLVRHGQTAANLQRRHQVEHSTLTTLGKEQAAQVAAQLKEIQPTHLLSSSMVRAIETARIIGEVCALVPETSHAFVEIKRPVGMYGRHHFSPRSLWFYVRWYLGSKAAERAEGESYRTFRTRIMHAKDQLATLPPDGRVVVVSHGVFITFFLIHMCNQRWLNPLQALRVYRDILSLQNGSVTAIRFDPHAGEQQCAWSVVK